MVGRPTDCTPEVTEIVCRELRLGLSIASACAAAGITKTSYYEYHQRAGEGTPFSVFAAATTKARSEGTRGLEHTVRKAAVGDWRAAAWMLERKAPEDWSKRTEITGVNGGPIEAQIVVAPALLDALADE